MGKSRGSRGRYRGVAEYLQVLTPSSPSGDIGCAPDNAGCSAGGAYLAYLEEDWLAEAGERLLQQAAADAHQAAPGAFLTTWR